MDDAEAATNEPREHYDREYDTGSYAATYGMLPVWAQAMNQWHVDFVIAALCLVPDKGPILDLGSGMGYYLDAWEARGFTTRGIEISEVAIKRAWRRNIDHGDATDLSRYRSGEFQLVFSAAFLEHVTDAQVTALIREQLRVASYAAHFIAHDKGNDPGHINIKTPEDWLRFFRAQSGGHWVALNNPLCPVQPAFLNMSTLPPQIEHAIQNYGRRT